MALKQNCIKYMRYTILRVFARKSDVVSTGTQIMFSRFVIDIC